jgi:hypothetical protein
MKSVNDQQCLMVFADAVAIIRKMRHGADIKAADIKGSP